MTFELFLKAIFDNIHFVAVLSLATMGILLVFKTSLTTNFAQGMMATLGVYTTAKLSFIMGIDIWISVLIGIVLSFVIGLIIDVLIIRNAKNVTIIGKQMITMGLVSVFLAVIAIVFGVQELSLPRFFDGNVDFNLFKVTLTVPKNSIFSLTVAFILISVVYSTLRFTKWGLGVRATASNEIVANMMGVNTRIITALSWSIAGGLGAIASILLASHGGSVSPGMMVSTQVDGFLAAILGGFSSFYGPIVGAIIIPIMRGIFSIFSSLWKDVMLYSLILLIILIKPIGLFGKRIAKKV